MFMMKRIPWTILLGVGLLKRTEPLRVEISFNDIPRSLTTTSTFTLVASSMTNAANLPVITSLLRVGDHGLRKSLEASCREWSAEIVQSVRKHCLQDRYVELLFFTPECITYLKSSEIPSCHLHGLLMYPPPEISHADMELLRVEEMEPRGLWWRLYAPTISWSHFLLQYPVYMDGPLFRVGMLDLLSGKRDWVRIVAIYTAILYSVLGTPAREIWPLFALMRVHPLLPPIPQAELTTMLGSRFFPQFGIATEYGYVARIVDLWLCIHSPSHCKQGEARPILESMLAGWRAIRFEEEPYIVMNALIVIVFGSEQFGSEERRTLMNRIIVALSQLDDFDFSNILGHAYAYWPCEQDRDCLARLVEEPDVQRRLLKIAPFGLSRWNSLLERTSLSRTYFRRWRARCVCSEYADRLATAADDKEIVQIIRQGPWDSPLPLPTWRLKNALQSTLDNHPALFVQHRLDGGHRIGVLLLELGPPGSASRNTQVEIMQLLLRIKLFNDDEPDSSAASDETSYELCLETIRMLDSTETLSVQLPSLSVVYPALLSGAPRAESCAV